MSFVAGADNKIKFVNEEKEHLNDSEYLGEKELIIKSCNDCVFTICNNYDKAIIQDSQKCKIIIAKRLKKIDIKNCGEIQFEFDSADNAERSTQYDQISKEYLDARHDLDVLNNMVKQLKFENTGLASECQYNKEELKNSEDMVVHLLDEKIAKNTNTNTDENGKISTSNAIQICNHILNTSFSLCVNVSN